MASMAAVFDEAEAQVVPRLKIQAGGRSDQVSQSGGSK
jgi:hypothetical protein